MNTTIGLTQKMTKESDLIKRYFKLLEDNEVMATNERFSIRIWEMKDELRNICWMCFIRFRELTLDLRQRFALNEEIDDKMGFLCCLPIEAFDKFITEDKSVISISSLKSLIQLRRLQISEFLRRIVCLFMTICFDKNSFNESNDYLKHVVKEVLKVFNQLIQETDQTFTQLFSQYNCRKSLWLFSEKSLIRRSDCKQTNQSIQTLNLLNTNRNIRKHLLSAFQIVDDCDLLIEDDIPLIEFRTKIRQNIDFINKEFKSLNDLVIDLEKLIRIEELKEHESKSITGNLPDVDQKDLILKPNLPNFEEYVVMDQVFEAFVSSDCDSDHMANDREDEDYNFKLSQESKDSFNLFRELKVALKTKAVEHKRREAKALGIDLIEINEESNDGSEEENDYCFKDKQLCNDLNDFSIDSNKSMNNCFERNESNERVNENNLFLTNNVFGFQSQIANIAAEKGRLFGLCTQTESFGDEEEPNDEICDN